MSGKSEKEGHLNPLLASSSSTGYQMTEKIPKSYSLLAMKTEHKKSVYRDICGW